MIIEALALACAADSFSFTSSRTAASVSPMIEATLSSVGAFMIEVASVESASSIASRSRAMVVCVTESEPAVMMVITRSPSSTKWNILR